MFGWFSEASVLASRWNRATRSGSDDEHLRQNLDRDVAIEVRVARPIHFAHAAGSEGGDDFVRTEAGAGGEGQTVALDYTGAGYVFDAEPSDARSRNERPDDGANGARLWHLIVNRSSSTAARSRRGDELNAGHSTRERRA